MKTPIFRALPFVTGVGLASASLHGLAPSGGDRNVRKQVDYAYVDEIFRRNHCVACHNNGAHPLAQLNLTTYDGSMNGGKDGKVIVPGDAEHSMMVKRITGVPGYRMPPQGGPLKSSEIETIKSWIDEGARTGPYARALSRLSAADKAAKWSEALKATNEIARMKFPGISFTRVVVEEQLPIFEATHDEKRWYAAAKKEVTFRPLNAGLLNGLAWTMVDPKGWLKRRNADLAIQAATLAVENSNRRSGAILDTLAWAYFTKGEKAKAVETENEALKCADATGGLRTALQESLKTFGP